MLYFCFFKQKTAYEMRISDWSSDVCSSNLHAGEQIVDQRAAEADRLEIIAAAIAGDDGDPHLRHDLEQAVVHRLAEAIDALVEREIAEQAARIDRKRTRMNSSHKCAPRMPYSA